jgi:hypothetical protein
MPTRKKLFVFFMVGEHGRARLLKLSKVQWTTLIKEEKSWHTKSAEESTAVLKLVLSPAY